MLTHHAQTRMQQRSISMSAVDILMDYGEHRRHHGAEIYYLSKRCRARLAKDLDKPAFMKLEKALDAYLVLGDDGTVITVAHRNQRLKF